MIRPSQPAASIRPRPAIAYYALLLLTGGLFSPWWLHFLMKDVNALRGRQVFDSRLIIGLLLFSTLPVVLLPFWIMLIDWENRRSIAGPMALLAVFGLLTMLIVLIQIYRQILQVSGRANRARDVVLIVVLTLPYFVSFPYLQSKLNALARSAASA